MPQHRRLLRERRERPRGRRAAEQRDEIAASHVGHGLPLPGVSTGNQRTAQSAYRTLSLPRKHQQVLGAGLNRSESRGGCVCLKALPERG